MRVLLLAAVASAGAALALPVAGSADNPVLTGDVGLNDGFAITLKDASGANVTHLEPGTYTLVVHDHSSIHNFHLYGPGASATVAATDIEFKGDETFTITLVAGAYTFVCDAHSSFMKGSFTVGSAPATTTTATTTTPPPPRPTPKLSGSVGPGSRIALRGAAGLMAGPAVVTVTDASKTDNFRLVGPGVNRATGVAFRGTVRWKVTLQAGSYSFRSDRHPKLHGGFTVAP